MRHYAWSLGRTSVRASNASTSLGSLWLFLEPVFSIVIYWLVFGQLLQISRGVEGFLAFLTVGQVTYGLSQRSLLGASGSLAAQAPMLRSLAFPRAVLPLSEVLKALSAYRAEAAVVFIAILLMGEQIRVTWLLLPGLVLLQAITSLGIGMGLARVVWRVNDAQRFLFHLMRLVFYASGVFFPLGRFTDSDLLLSLAALNPFYDQVSLARWILLGLRPDQAPLVVIGALAWTVVSLVVGGTYFVKGESAYSGARTVAKAAR